MSNNTLIRAEHLSSFNFLNEFRNNSKLESEKTNKVKLVKKTVLNFKITQE